MRERHNIFAHIDWWLVIIFLLLVTIGSINIYAAVFDENHISILDTHVKYGKQLGWVITALFLGFVILLIDEIFLTICLPDLYYFHSIIDRCYLLGKEIYGSKSWFQFAGIALQPGEFAKMATGLALAKFLSKIEVDVRKRNDCSLHLGLFFFLHS